MEMANTKSLGMPNVRFHVNFSNTEVPTPRGMDKVAFLFSANLGAPLQNISQVASGGETARVMLSLKALLSGTVCLPTIIFDEIDTGVSGSVANAVGEVIATLSSTMQVIDITHLPQVASKGNRHYLVYKSDSTTNMRVLTDNERITEIAKMLSGDSVTDAAIAQAKILLQK
mgnify:CR=1 FL=1